jgi:predicted FMN-binding regulatory protein PaiB
MDRANPHADLLAGQRILAIFHGPNAYISPHVYQTDQLPTWNSIAVHVRGKVRVLSDRQELVRGLMGICEQSDPAPGGFRLDPQDPRIERLIDFIVGFEIEIDDLIGRFKLSQDRTEADRKRAAQQIACNTGPQDRALIERLLADGLHEPSQGPV